MELKERIAALRAAWTKVQEQLFDELDDNETMEQASDDITYALSVLSIITEG